jgi:hypothetical protein
METGMIPATTTPVHAYERVVSPWITSLELVIGCVLMFFKSAPANYSILNINSVLYIIALRVCKDSVGILYSGSVRVP